MADLLDKAHVDAALTLLRDDAGPPPLVVYPDVNGNTPAEGSRAKSYVLVYSYIERPRAADGNGLDGRSVAWTVRWYCHCVGPTENSATATAMRVNRALMDVRPVIAGRSCDLIEQEAAQPPTRDETTGTPVFDHIVVYRLRTQPG